MSNWELLPPEGGKGSTGGDSRIQARPAKVLRPIPITDDSETTNGFWDWIREALTSVLSFLRRNIKTVIGLTIVAIIGYMVWQIVVGFLAFIAGIYNEVANFGNGYGIDIWKWVKYPFLVAMVLLAIRFTLWAYQRSALSGTRTADTTGTASTWDVLMCSLYNWWVFARKVATVIFFAWLSWFVVILVLQNAEYYKKQGPRRVTEAMATSTTGPRSQFFVGQTHFVSEIVKFCYFDQELNLSREEGWDCTDLAKLESGFQMYNLDGSVRRGDQNKEDIGVFMINRKWSAKEIAEAGCNIESFECQKKVFRLIFLEKRSFERWTAYPRVKNLTVTPHTVSAPVGEWGEIFNPPDGDSCFVKPDRNLEMLAKDGTPMPISPEYVPFTETPTLQFRSTDETPAEVTILCR